MTPSRSALALMLVVGSAACANLIGLDAPTYETSADGGASADADASTDSSGLPCNTTSFETDRSNCGACGQDCFGGECIEGTCRPTVFAADQTNARTLISANGDLYWVTFEGNVRRCPTDKCVTPTALADAGYAVARIGFATMALDSSYVYWGHAGDNTIWRVRVDGGTIDEFFVGESVFVAEGGATYAGFHAGLVLDDAGVYFAVREDNEGIYFCPKSGVCSSPTKLADTPAKAGHLAQDDTHLYWAASPEGIDTDDQGKVHRADKARGGSLQSFVLANALRTQGVAARDGAAYFTTLNDGGPQDGIVHTTASSTPLATRQNRPGPICTDERYAYWANRGDSNIYRCALSGCNDTPETVATLQTDVEAIAVDDKAIYWAVADAIVRVAKKKKN